jgi:signal transduction histidine kinase
MAAIGRGTSVIRPDRNIFHRTLLSWELTPFRIALIYLVFGMLALFFSDVYLVQQLNDPLLGQVQALKGGVEVLATGGVIYGLTKTKDAQSSWRAEKIDQQREELLVLHRVLRHNLRNDLNVVMGLGDFLRTGDFEDQIVQKGETIHRVAEKMVHYTEQASRIRKVSSNNGAVVEIDLATTMRTLLKDHPDVGEDVRIDLDISEPATVEVNHMFVEAIAELIGNAIQHNDKGTPEIECVIDRTAGPIHLVELSISDNGPGIPENVSSVLKESETDQLSHLQGMGLWFVSWVVSTSNGNFVIEENERGGTIARVQVPSTTFSPTAQLGRAVGARW